jgi:glycosyltransferase involved in cell wall biosynthesis
VGGIPEIIEHGKNGVLVNPADPQQLADACIQLLSNEDKRRELSTAGFETAKEKFDVRTQVEHLKGIYINLIEQYKYTKDEPPAKYNSR